jgi:hypothetical protein
VSHERRVHRPQRRGHPADEELARAATRSGWSDTWEARESGSCCPRRSTGSARRSSRATRRRHWKAQEGDDGDPARPRDAGLRKDRRQAKQGTSRSAGTSKHRRSPGKSIRVAAPAPEARGARPRLPRPSGVAAQSSRRRQKRVRLKPM